MKTTLFIAFINFSCFLIAQSPNAQFTASFTNICLGAPIQFTNQSTAGSAPIVSYNWNFGNGNASTDQNPTYTYPAPGNYTVTLSVQASNGQADAEVKIAYITVNPIPEPAFTISGNGCTIPFSVSFNNSTPHISGQTYLWNFGNGQTSSSQFPPNLTYSAVGNYNVSLTVSSLGCSKTLTKPMLVSNYTADIISPVIICRGQAVTFTDNSTVGTTSWQWNAGNAGTSTLQNPTFTFPTAGTFSVTLSVQNATSGCSATITKQIIVLPKPTPTLTANRTKGCSPLQVTFTNTSAAGTFVWYFGDGTSYVGQTPPPHTYTGNSMYSVKLVMTNANGCKDSITYPNLIKISDPVAQFSATPLNGCSPINVSFTQSSTSPDPINNPITTWKWNFGDGTTYIGQNPPIHTYTTGVYTVSLIVILQSGCSDTILKPAYIKVGAINSVNFSFTPAAQCANSNIQFTSNASITVPHSANEVTYSWNFGDSTFSNLKNPTHKYDADTGYFDVSLLVNFRGCKDSIKITNAIYIKAPISKFVPAQTLYCNPGSLPVNVAVTDNSIIGKLTDNVSMTWKWGDNSVTNLGNIDLHDADKGSSSHNYSAYGSYTIKQVVYNATTGCSDSTTTLIHISKTTAIFSIPNDSICKNNVLNFDGSLSTSTHPFGTYIYYMGNGATRSGLAPTYSYNIAGTYAITFVATNNVGCSDTSVFSPFTVLQLPKAQITSSHSSGCAPLLATYTNTSSTQGNGVPLSSFDWTFSNGAPSQTTTSVSTNVTNLYTTEGSFNVILTVTDRFGCVSTPVLSNLKITKPVAKFTMDSVVCNLEDVTAINQTTGFYPISYQWTIDGGTAVTSTNFSTSFNDTPINHATHTSHQIKLKATDGNGCIQTLSKTIIVSTPYANFDYTITGSSVNENGEFGCPPLFVNFDDQSQSYGNVVSWNWDFDDNGNSSTNQNPNNTFVFPGSYSTTLTITDEYGCKSDTTVVDYLTIYGPKGIATWIQSVDNCGQDVTFNITGLENVTNILWNTGDGTSYPDSITFMHSFLGEGVFSPTVTLIDLNGCTVTFPMAKITIETNALTAFFTPNSNEVNIGKSIFYDQQSSFTSNPIINWLWNFGNNAILNNNTGVDITYTHGEPGVFPVSLIVTDINGCRDKYVTTVTIKADFEMPNVFTPNGDGINDEIFISDDIFEKFNLVIVNRWGDIVSEQKNKTGMVFWDGTNKGNQMCYDGVYFYNFVGTLKGGKVEIKKEGFFSLLGSK
ncbi:MAG: PKD domain-containing protein [Crocinitomicaceae bacterium]|nr:PKD domain-containing protein [Crocinitomicaceae bacterium]